MQWVQMATKGIASFADASVAAGNYRTESKVEAQNARNLEDESQAIGAAGARDEERVMREYRLFAGKQAGQISESGLSNDGSALDLVSSSESTAYLDALNIRADSDERRRETLYGARQAQYRSNLAKKMAGRAKYKMFLEATGILGNTDKFAGLGGGGRGTGGMAIPSVGRRRAAAPSTNWSAKAASAGG